MNFEPFDTDLVIARVKAIATDFRLVGGAADYASVKSLREFVLPSAYVLFAAEAGGNGGPTGAKAQAASADFGVAVVVRNFRDQRGGQLNAELRKLIGQVRSALIGWMPPAPGAAACQWRGGAVMDYDDAALLWVDAFSCSHVLQR